MNTSCFLSNFVEIQVSILMAQVSHSTVSIEKKSPEEEKNF